MRPVSHLFALAAFGGLVGAAGAQDPGRDKELAKLRAEAAGLDARHSSELFEFLADRDRRGPLEVSDEQLELVDRLDHTVRQDMRVWLLRGLDEQPPLPPAELNERYAQRWGGVRKNAVAHAEAIVLEGILTPAQARKVKSSVRVSAAGPLSPRYCRLPKATAGEPQSAVEFYGRLRSLAVVLNRSGSQASSLFRIITADQDGPPDVTPEQIRLARELSDVASAVCGGRLVRGLPAKPARGDDSRIEELSSRLSEGLRVYDSIVAHAEQITLETVLTPKQAEWSKRRLWQGLGLKALLDPEMASILKLSKSQREELVARFASANRTIDEANSAASVLRNSARVARSKQRPDSELKEARARRAEDELNAAVSQLEASVMEVLRTSQARALVKLIARPAPVSRTAKPEAREKAAQ
jgi:hypothetical protein